MIWIPYLDCSVFENIYWGTHICKMLNGLLSVSRSVMSDFCNPMDCSQPGSAVHGILQARKLEVIAISFSKASSRPRDWTRVSCIAGRFFTSWAIRGALSSTQFRSKSQNTDKCLPAWTSVLVGEANNDKENFLTFWVKTKVDYEAVCYYLVECLGKEYRSKNKKLL